MQTDGTRYSILALAPFDPNPALDDRGTPLEVTRETLDEKAAALNIRYCLPLDTNLCPSGGIELAIDGIKALQPDSMLQKNGYLKRLLEAGAFVDRARKDSQTVDQIADGLRRWPDLPKVALPITPNHKTVEHSDSSRDAIDQILQMVAMPAPPGRSPIAGNPLQDMPAQILNALLRRPDFRRMEAAWRGLRLLLSQGAVSDSVRVAIAPLRPESPIEGLHRLSPRLQADPPSLIIVDWSFDNTPLSIERLRALSQWADALMVPVLAWVSPAFLQIDSWEELTALSYLPHHLDTAAYAKYRTLRQAPESRWLSLTCNRFLVRYPYGPENPPRRISMQEPTPLWIAPVWGLATLVAQSVCHTGWPTRFTEGARFQLHDLAAANSTRTPPIVTEFSPDADRRAQLLKIGLSPLSTEAGRDRAFCNEAVTLAGSSLKHQLMIGQVSQFIRWCREHLPVDRTPADLQFQLKLAFQVFSERSRPAGLAEVRVDAQTPDEAGCLPVRVLITPTMEVLPGEDPIELQLNW